MMHRRNRALGVVLIGLAGGAHWPVLATDSPRAGGELTLTLVHPDEQAREILRLFDGTRAPSPAAALAGWRRVTREPHQVGKPLQAAIAFLNPAMIREWSTLHRMRLVISNGPPARWRLTVPGDDGTIAAFATAMRLSGGTDEPPLAESGDGVERLGGMGKSFAVRSSRGVAFASSREELGFALAELKDDAGRTGAVRGPSSEAIVSPTELGSGLTMRLDVEGIVQQELQELRLRQLVVFLQGVGLRHLDGMGSIDGDSISWNLIGGLTDRRQPDASDLPAPAIDPAWLHWFPVGQSRAVVAIALDRGPKSWDRAFDIADRVDRSDPRRASLAPLRTRLNLVAAARGVLLEADLWPHIVGISAGWIEDHGERIGGPGRVFGAIHCVDPSRAEKILSGVAARLAGIRLDPKDREVAAGALRGRQSGRTLELAREGSSVLVAWGEGTLKTCLETKAHPERSVSAQILGDGVRPGATRPGRVGAYWPGRGPLPIRGLDPTSPFVSCLAEGPPLIWTGWGEGDRTRDRIAWVGLKNSVRRFLDAIPIDHEPTPRPPTP